ncbi:MAG: hypothetical protein ABII23_01795 [bacterium]
MKHEKLKTESLDTVWELLDQALPITASQKFNNQAWSKIRGNKEPARKTIPQWAYNIGFALTIWAVVIIPASYYMQPARPATDTGYKTIQNFTGFKTTNSIKAVYFKRLPKQTQQFGGDQL